MRPSTLRGCALALLSLAIVCSLKLAFDDAIGRDAPFVLLGLVVVGAGWLGGARAALFATGAAVLATWYLFNPPYYTFSLGTPETAIRLTAFALEGLAIAGIVQRMHGARQTAAASGDAHHATVDAALDSIIVSDEQGRIVEFNRSAERTFGLKRSEALGRSFVELLAPSEQRAAQEKLLSEVLHAAASPLHGKRLECHAIRANGSEFAAELSITASDVEGSRRLTAFVRDISEAAKLERDKRAAQEAADAAVHLVARLQALTAALAAAQTPEDVASSLVREGVVALGADVGMVLKPSGETHLELVAQHGLLPENAAALRLIPVDARLPTTTAFRTSSPEWVQDPADYAARFGESYKAVGQLSAAVAALPLIVDGRRLGVMAFRFAEARLFSAEEQATMETFAKQAAQALERAQLYAHELAARRRLEALSDLAEALSQALTQEDVARVIVDRGTRVAGADTCVLYALDERALALNMIGQHGANPEVAARLQRITAESGGPFFDSIRSGKTQWVENQEQYLKLSPSLATMKVDGPRPHAFWSVPLIAEGKAMGLLGMGFFAPRRFPQDEREFVEIFARHCAQALRRAQRVETERAARAVAERLQTSLETTLRSIGDAVIATDDRGNVTLMNPVAEQLTGWPEQEAQGRPLRQVFAIVNEQTRAEVESPVDKVLREGLTVGLANHTVLLGRHGRETPIDDSGAPIRNADGLIAGVVLVFRDVSEKKAAEGRQTFLAEATSVLAQSLDGEATLSLVAQLAVPTLADWCAVNLVEDGRRGSRQLAVAHVDPAKAEYARELGRKYPPDPNATVGLPNVLRTGKSELYAEISDEMLQVAAVDEEHLRISRELQLRSAMVVPLAARGRVLGAMTFVWAESKKVYTEADLRFAEELARRCATAIDNSRLYAAEQAARQSADVANHAKDQFLATISHELRTPLNAIMGWAKMMSSAALDESKRSRAVETIERNAVAMAQLIEDLLDVSRIISGKMRLETQAVDLGRIIESALESVKPAADAKEISIGSMLDTELGPIIGDPTRLQQIVWNLLSNAVKFTPRGGRVDVVLRRAGSSAEVCVSDNGKGIDSRFLPYVFEPFRQEDASSTRTRGGLGLGLAITRQLVELHGGSIIAESQGDGRGSTFVVQLPLSAVARLPGADGQRGAREIRLYSEFERPIGLRGIRVLVVDDEPDGRTLVRAILEECGCVVRTAGGVDDALEQLSSELPDLLISDIGMPGRDGYDLIRRVRAMPAGRGGSLPAAALTAYARAEDRRQILSAGFSMHVPKPVEPAELVAVAATLARLSSRSLS